MVIGVTGGVGAGKSTVLEQLEKHFGAHLIIADEVAKELMEPQGASYEAVVDAFGREILNEEGQIDRQRLAGIVFNDDEKLELLNSLTHPKVRTEIERRIASVYEKDANALIVVEAALLIEAGYEEMLDELWVIDADPEVRIQRLMENRGYSREKCLDIMNNQLSNEEFRTHADEVIDNSGTLDETLRRIEAVLAGKNLI